MPKYYAQCGPIETILIADSAESAAMAALDRMLQTHLWIYDDPGLSEDDCRVHLMLEALLHLEPEIRVSERGFHRADAVAVGTPETIERWHRLILGMRGLFVAAGLSPRPMTRTANDDNATVLAGRRFPR